MKRPLVLGIALAVALSAAAACKKSEEAAKPTGEQAAPAAPAVAPAAPAAPAAPEAAKPGAKKHEGKHEHEAKPGTPAPAPGQPAPAQPTPAPDKPET